MPPFDFRAEDLQRLRRLTSLARVPLIVSREGQHRTRRAGEGIEFLDYRPYVLGDDPRHVDWNLYGRLRQLVVRVYERRENLSVTVLVDVSESMSFGEPSSKAAHACRIACGLAYVALVNGERVSVASFGVNLGRLLGPLRGREHFWRIVDYLRASQMGAQTDLSASLSDACRARQRKGLLVIISDFLLADGYERALRMALSSGYQLLLVQALDECDYGATLDGYRRVYDSETGREQLVYVDEFLRRRMRTSIRTYCEGLESFCRSRRQRYLLTHTRDDYLEFVCNVARSQMRPQ